MILLEQTDLLTDTAVRPVMLSKNAKVIKDALLKHLKSYWCVIMAQRCTFS